MKKIDPKVDEAIQTLNMKDGPSRRKLLAGTGLVSATAAASALLAACTSSSSGGTESVTQSSAAAVAGSFPKTPSWKFYFVNHVTTNAFFTPTQYGMADAASLLGLPAPVWGGSQNSIISEMTANFNTAIAAGAAGIALAAISATAFTSPVSSAMTKGIPVVTYNADGEYINGKPVIGTNRLCYVGQSLYSSGQSMGEQIKLAVPGGRRHRHLHSGGRDREHPATVRRRGVGARQQLQGDRDRDRRHRVRGARGHEGVPERAQVHAEGRVRRRLR